VILVEADLRRPSMARYTGVQSPNGLSGLLSGQATHLAHELLWVDATSMRPVTLEDLKDGLSFALLTGGAPPPHPQRLLARPEMAATIDTARSLADIVIIDTPPIGTVNDAAALARLVDTVVVVARMNKTTKDAARRALRTLRNLATPLTGVVVTDAREGEQYAYYGTEPSVEDTRGSAVEGVER
jgi:Mrp family chromosome partitioning ATPase